MKWVLGYLAAVCVLLIVLAQSIFIPTFFMPFFDWQYQRRETAQLIGVEQDELMRVTRELLDYMRGRRDSLEDIYATVHGFERRFFSDIEIRHMVDVLHLYDAGFLIRNVAFWVLLLLVLAMAYFKMPLLQVLARCCREVLVGFLLLLAILAGVIIWDFREAFVVFHLIFFDNDYWILNPRVDLLINMVPTGFFIDISIFVGLLLLAFSAIIIAASTLYLRAFSPQTRTFAKFGR